jgi:hypothetical protein
VQQEGERIGLLARGASMLADIKSLNRTAQSAVEVSEGDVEKKGNVKREREREEKRVEQPFSHHRFQFLFSRTQDGREAASEAKKSTDQWHLKLQALEYHIHHYTSKIAQCQEFK